MTEVNLIPPVVAKKQKSVKEHAILNIVSVTLLLLIIFLISALFLYRTVVNKSFETINAQVKDSESKIESYRQVEGILSSLQKKFSVYQSYGQTLPLYSDVWQKLESLLPSPDTSFQKLDIDETGNISLSLQTVDFSQAANFLSSLQTAGFENVKIRSVSKQQQTGKIITAAYFNSQKVPKGS